MRHLYVNNEPYVGKDFTEVTFIYNFYECIPDKVLLCFAKLYIKRFCEKKPNNHSNK